MKNLLIQLTFVLLIVKTSFGQINLVPNPSFENFSYCPTTQGDLHGLNNWLSFGLTPDYYNSCAAGASFPDVSVPSNFLGYQDALDGNSYIGVATWCSPCNSTDREYVGVQLTQTLSIGLRYYVSAYISRADSNFGFSVCPTDNFGFRFSGNSFNSVNVAPTNNFSHVHSNTIINNRLGWTKISGSFVADSNYRFVTIGNFYDNINTNSTACTDSFSVAYYYVDKICVSLDSMTCNPLASVNEMNKQEKINIFPNPSSDFISTKLFNSKIVANVMIMDELGQIILSKANFNLDKIEIKNFADGFYFIQVIIDNRKYYDKLIIKH